MRNVAILAQAVASLYPNKGFAMDGDDLGTLRFVDTTVVVSEADIIAEYTRLDNYEPTRIADENRRAAYQTEADPLFFKVQRGEIPQQQWLDKVAEIKARYPKPTE
jgi:hypothetical protein